MLKTDIALMKGGNCLFYYLCSKIISMTFEEAVSLVDRIKDQVCLQKGEDEAISEFLGKSFSVYGKSVTYIKPDLPKWDVTVLDDWEKTIYN